jgi:hypothetical protein
MEAIVKKDFVNSREKKTYKVGDTFSADKQEIDRINSILVDALEVSEVKEVKQKSRRKK